MSHSIFDKVLESTEIGPLIPLPCGTDKASGNFRVGDPHLDIYSTSSRLRDTPQKGSWKFPEALSFRFNMKSIASCRML